MCSLSKPDSVDTVSRIARVDKKDICYLTGLFEAYEGLAVIRTIDAQKGLLAFWISPEFTRDVLTISRHLMEEMEFAWID